MACRSWLAWRRLTMASSIRTDTNYAQDALRWAVSEGIISGKPGNILDPRGQATRAQVAVMLQRFLEK